jgi:molecular chaperone GrpE
MTETKDAAVPEDAQPDVLELDATAEMPPEFVAPGAEQPAAVAEDEEGSFMSASDQKLAEANERYVRLMADFDNFRKRAAKERLDAQAYAVEEAIREIIPVMDNLERALGASQQAGAPAEGSVSVVKGVELTLRMFQVVLGKFGVERMLVVGKPFDPNLHEALMQMESDEVQVETVSEELEPGYVMKGRVVRPARVKVMKPKPADAAV